MIFRQKFYVAGVPSTIAYDDGLKSTAAEKKRLLSISIVASLTKDNDIQGYHEKAKVFEIPTGSSTSRSTPGPRTTRSQGRESMRSK